MRTRKALIALIVSLALLFLDGCRLGPEPDSIVRLSWWITFAQESSEYAAFEAIASAYAEQHPDIEVELVPVPWDDIAPRGDGMTRLALAQQQGDGPDIWGPVPHNWTGSFALAGQAQVLEPGQIEGYREYIDVALQACQFDGKQYGLPVLMDAVALIYNRELVPDPPDSFEDLVDLAKEWTDAEEDRWGLVLPLLSQVHIYPFVDGYGGYILRCDAEGCDPGDIGLNNEGAVRGIQYLSDLFLVERLFPESLADRAVMHDRALALFTGGRAAMLIDGPWVLPEIRASGIAYGVASIPTLPDGSGDPRSLTMVQAMYASASSAHPVAALALLNHIAGEEGVTALYGVLDTHGTPVRQDVLRSEPFRGDREVRAWRDQAARGVPLPTVPELGYVWIPWGQALDEAIPGLTPVRDALDRAVEEIQGYLEEEGAAPAE